MHRDRLAAGFFLLCLISGCPQAVQPEAFAPGPPRIVSLDYCADQFVLKFVAPENILALSPDATKHFSYMRDSAKGLPQVRSSAEAVLALQPTTVVRSYGGGPYARQFFSAAGVDVVQLDFPADLDAVANNILKVARQLGVSAKGTALVSEMEHRLLELQRAPRRLPSLYVTPGGVTTGPGSLVHEVLEAAGLSNFELQKGWRPVPLERLAGSRPDLLVAASFGQKSAHVDAWTLARHPLMMELMDAVPRVDIDGAWTSCGGWFLLDAIEALAQRAAGIEDSGL
ncbi:MAG: ABC transporter substrate-binding protein [Gammaproteobacteria bacterium]|nr:ABC transporter substrate-binding protein [Gammaproteobacteria bacterium]